MKKFFSSKQTSSPERERFFNSLVSIPARIVFSLLLTAVIGLFVVIPGCGSGGDLGEIILGEGFPAAQIWIERAVVGTSTPLTMFGQGSDVDGGALGYEWDFEDDGTFDSTAQNPSTMYAVSGTYTVRLRVTDDEGKSSDATASVLVLGSGSAPAVVVRAWTLHARASGEVTFCAEAEDSLGADVADYAFDFTDDGAFDQSGTSATATNIYTSNDKFTCRVRVTDALGVTSDATVVVVFCTEPYPDYPPSAMIEVPGGTLVTDLTTAIDFKAVGSDIDGGAVASITWDFDGDGFFTDASGREVSATFPEAGQNRVQVRITDNDGTIASIAEVTVVSEAVPGGPGITAHAFADAVHASVGTPINFHCRAENPDGSAVAFSWDFDGDGIVDSTAADAVFAFGLPGIYIPNCRVSDAGGDIATSDLVVIIEDCEGILGPYFWWDCLEEPTIYHGGTKTGRLRVGLGFSLLGGDPQQYQILHKQGGLRCFDFYGELVTVEDHANNVLATNTTGTSDVPTPLVGARPPPSPPSISSLQEHSTDHPATTPTPSRSNWWTPVSENKS